LKTHFYPFTGQEKPVSLNILQALGVPASTVTELMRVVTTQTPAGAGKGGRRG
jgi:hypothetical protein